MLTPEKMPHPKKVNLKSLVIGSAAVLALALSGCSGGDPSAEETGGSDVGYGLAEDGKLHIVSITGQVPISYVDINGEPAGFGNELLGHIAEEMGLEAVYTTDTPAGSLSGVKLGKYDIGSAAGVYLPSRLEEYAVTIPWYNSPSIIVELESTDYSDMSDLEGKRVGVVEGTAQSATIEEYPDVEAVTFDAQASEITALKAKQIDAILLGGENARGVVVDDDALKLGAEIPSPYHSGYLGSADNQELMDEISKHIEAAMNDGTFMRLWNEHVDRPVGQPILDLYPVLSE